MFGPNREALLFLRHIVKSSNLIMSPFPSIPFFIFFFPPPRLYRRATGFLSSFSYSTRRFRPGSPQTQLTAAVFVLKGSLTIKNPHSPLVIGEISSYPLGVVGPGLSPPGVGSS